MSNLVSKNKPNYMWQRVYVTKIYSDGYISLKDLYKFSGIYKHKYAYLKSKKSEK